MHADLQPGTSAEIVIQVTESMCPAFDGRIVHRVYSTWSLAHHMELAARRVLAPRLDPDEEGIGSHLSIDHIAPTPLGATVRVVATATHVDATTVECAVDAYHAAPDGSLTSTRRTFTPRPAQSCSAAATTGAIR